MSLFGAKPATTTVAATALPSFTPNTTTIASSTPTTAPSLDPSVPVDFQTFEELLESSTVQSMQLFEKFRKQMTEVNAYDGVLRGNHNKIQDLLGEMDTLDDSLNRVMHNSAAVGDQLKALESAVVEMENHLGMGNWVDGSSNTNQLMGVHGVNTAADRQRQYIHNLLQSTDAQLLQTEDDLQQAAKMVDNLKSAKSPPEVNSATLKKVLEKQMNMLSWLDNSSDTIKERIASVRQ